MLGAGSLAQANTVYTILEVFPGYDGFSASQFHDSASGPNFATGTTLATIDIAPVISGTFNDDTGALNATIEIYRGGTFTLSGTGLIFDSNGILASNSQLNITFSDPVGALQDDTLGFMSGYVCCGRSDQDPNSFISTGNKNVMSLLGANFGGGTFNGSYDDAYGARLATFGMDIRLNMAPVPIPAAVWLFGSGLLGLVGVARRS